MWCLTINGDKKHYAAIGFEPDLLSSYQGDFWIGKADIMNELCFWNVYKVFESPIINAFFVSSQCTIKMKINKSIQNVNNVDIIGCYKSHMVVIKTLQKF